MTNWNRRARFDAQIRRRRSTWFTTNSRSSADTSPQSPAPLRGFDARRPTSTAPGGDETVIYGPDEPGDSRVKEAGVDTASAY